LTALRQFRDEPSSIEAFEKLFRPALVSLVPDLADAPWYIREREVVNLFVFKHLVREFQDAGFDIGQINIEVPVGNVIGKRASVYADIIVSLHGKATFWRTCRPLARIEWKNINCIEKFPKVLEAEHELDVEYLSANSHFFQSGYAVLTDQRNGGCSLECEKILAGNNEQFLFERLKPRSDLAESAANKLKACKGFAELVRRPQACRECGISAETPATP
jgi:hypothetical protein